jgi:hypothetical protein
MHRQRRYARPLRQPGAILAVVDKDLIRLQVRDMGPRSEPRPDGAVIPGIKGQVSDHTVRRQCAEPPPMRFAAVIA